MIEPVHHSLADWDKSSTYWTLSTKYYTSAPTSLVGTAYQGPTFLCNHPSTLCIPQGRILCNILFDPPRDWNVHFTFRNQCPTDQVPNFQNCYEFLCHRWEAWVQERVNGKLTWSKSWPQQLPYTEWFTIEITWWNYPPSDTKHPLAFQYRAYYDRSWHDFGRTQNDLARWHDSPINRVGFRLYDAGNYIDDTEIHAPVWPPPTVKMIYTSILSAIWPSNPSGSWVEWDLSSIIPAEAIAVEVSISATDANTAGCRPFGSTLSRVFSLGAAPLKNSYTLQCEVGTNRKIETMRALAPAVEFRIIGYWIPE